MRSPEIGATLSPEKLACLSGPRQPAVSEKGFAVRPAITALTLAAACLLVASCGQKDSANIVVKDKDGGVTISANGQHFTMNAGDGKNRVTINGNGEHFVMHAGDGRSEVRIDTNGVNVRGGLPAFVSIYPEAKVVSLVSGSAKGGTMVLETKAAPDAVIGFYRQKAEGAGFKQILSANDAGNLLYGASSGPRTVQVLASKDGDGTHAQVAWSDR